MTTLDELPVRLKRVLIDCLELDRDARELASDASLKDELGFDSAALLELVAGIEAEFDIEIDTEEITQAVFESVDSLARFLAART